jgi:hypothetical protein
MIYLGANPGVVYTGGYGYGTGMINGTFSVTTAGNNRMTIALKTRAGLDPTVADPVMIIFPTTAVAGGFTILTVSTAVSFVMSAGSTMGVTNATAFRIWIVGFNDSGTFRIGAINCSTATQVFPLFDGIRTSVAEAGSGNSDSAGVIYTSTLVTNQPMRILGYAEWNSGGLATAGTWTSTNLSYVQLFGPGIPTPGQVIQTIQTTTATATTVTNNSAVFATANAATITPTSAANLIKATAVGGWISQNGNDAWVCFIGRNAGAIVVGNKASNYSSDAVNTYMQLTNTGLDKPNSVSVMTYIVYIGQQTGSNNLSYVYNPQMAGPQTAAMILMEMMG